MVARQPIFLASTSPRRTQLLTQVGIDHEILRPVDDESVDAALAPSEVVRSLAVRKARSVLTAAREGLVIGADTIVVANGSVLGKPSDPLAARAMLAVLSGSKHEVYSGVAVIDAASGQERSGVRCTSVTFRALTTHEIATYVASGEPMDKAGAYSIQGKGAVFVSGIEGDFYAVVGLPLQLTEQILQEFGWQRS